MSSVSDIRDLGEHQAEGATVRGWDQTTRVHGRVAFVVVRDGTGILQCVVVQKEVPPEVWQLVQELTLESSVIVTGAVRADARAPGGYELSVQQLELIGASDEYPIQPKEHGVDFLLDHRHLWLR
jgi:asparaginyl-tRNA synthetase